jgi:hypothetical protein
MGGRADARPVVNDDPGAARVRGRAFSPILCGLSSAGEVADALSSAQTALVIGSSSLSRLHSPSIQLSDSHLSLLSCTREGKAAVGLAAARRVIREN